MEQQTLRRRIFGIAAHVLLISILFILPELVMTVVMPTKHAMGIRSGMFFKTVIYLVTFYVNYFFIIDRTFVKSLSGRNFIKFLLWNFVVIVVALIMCFLASRYSYQVRHNAPLTGWHEIAKTLTFLVRDLVMIILTIGFAVALRLSTKWQDIRRQKQEILAAQRDSELAGLKSQLNPHFLFNTLNTIYALIDIDGSKAQKAVHQLSALLRYMLYDDNQNVELSKECRFVENYVELMRMRVANHHICVDINLGSHATTLIPSLLFIPLVENAVKYGTRPNDKIPVEISIEAKEHTLVCCTRNSFVKDLHTTEEAARSSGIGLVNLRRRLTLIYGTKATLTTETNHNIFISRLTIPL